MWKERPCQVKYGLNKLQQFAETEEKYKEYRNYLTQNQFGNFAAKKTGHAITSSCSKFIMQLIMGCHKYSLSRPGQNIQQPVLHDNLRHATYPGSNTSNTTTYYTQLGGSKSIAYFYRGLFTHPVTGSESKICFSFARLIKV